MQSAVSTSRPLDAAEGTEPPLESRQPSPHGVPASSWGLLPAAAALGRAVRRIGRQQAGSQGADGARVYPFDRFDRHRADRGADFGVRHLLFDAQPENRALAVWECGERRLDSGPRVRGIARSDPSTGLTTGLTAVNACYCASGGFAVRLAAVVRPSRITLSGAAAPRGEPSVHDSGPRRWMRGAMGPRTASVERRHHTAVNTSCTTARAAHEEWRYRFATRCSALACARKRLSSACSSPAASRVSSARSASAAGVPVSLSSATRRTDSATSASHARAARASTRLGSAAHDAEPVIGARSLRATLRYPVNRIREDGKCRASAKSSGAARSGDSPLSAHS